MKQLVYFVKNTGCDGSPSEACSVSYVCLEMIQKPSKENSKLKRLHVIQVQGHLEAVRWSRGSWIVDRGSWGRERGRWWEEWEGESYKLV